MYNSFQLDISSEAIERVFITPLNTVTTAVKRTSKTIDSDELVEEILLKTS